MDLPCFSTWMRNRGLTSSAQFCLICCRDDYMFAFPRLLLFLFHTHEWRKLFFRFGALLFLLTLSDNIDRLMSYKTSCPLTWLFCEVLEDSIMLPALALAGSFSDLQTFIQFQRAAGSNISPSRCLMCHMFALQGASPGIGTRVQRQDRAQTGKSNRRSNFCRERNSMWLT